MGWMTGYDRMTLFEKVTAVPIIFILLVWQSIIQLWPVYLVVALGAIAWKYIR